MTHIFGGLRGEGEQKQIEIAATDSLKPWFEGGEGCRTAPAL